MNDGNELSFHSKYITQLMTQLLGFGLFRIPIDV